MKRLVVRNTINAIGAVGILTAVLTACGGGGNTSPAPQAPLVLPSTAPVQTVNNFTGPTSTITVSIKIPRATEPTAALHAKLKKLYGSKANDKNIRTMANVSPSASIRAAGLSQQRTMQAFEQKTGRSPAFISGNTETAEFVLSNGSFPPLVDQPAQCSTSTCTMTITAPVGSGFTAALYLYDTCDFLLSAGSVSGVNVTAGVTTPVNITLNPVVGFVDVETTGLSSPFLEDPSQAGTFNVTVTPLDVDDEAVTTPGVLIDNNFRQITSFNLTATGTDPNGNSPITPSDICVNACPGSQTAPLAVSPSLTVPASTWAFAGNGFEQDVNLNANPVTTGSPLAPDFFSQGNFEGSDIGLLDLPVVPAQLTWIPQMTGLGVFTTELASPNNTTANVEFPVAANSNTLELALNESISGLATHVAVTDNGHCGSVVALYAPPEITPFLLSSIVASPFYQITMGSSSNSNNCVVTATDDASTPHTASMTFLINSTNITIQNKSRAKK
jgi:hypothetical protein